MRRAAELAEGFLLRGYDSIHLTAADYLQRQLRELVVFASFDNKLNRAARILGLQLPEFIAPH